MKTELVNIEMTYEQCADLLGSIWDGITYTEQKAGLTQSQEHKQQYERWIQRQNELYNLIADARAKAIREGK